jgi:hypothetical protein
MSLGSFIARLVGSIAKLFSNLPTELKSSVHIGVAVVAAFKALIDSPVTDIITAIIPTQIDDVIKDKLRQYLPIVLVEMRLVDATLNLTDPNEIAAAALKTIAALGADIRPGVLHQLSILIAQVAADGKLTWSDGVYIIEYYYKNEFQLAA